MSSCTASYHASILMEQTLNCILSKAPRSEIENILFKLGALGADNITPCTECAPCHDFIFYSNTLKKVLNHAITAEALVRELHEWKKVQLTDKVLTHMHAILSKDDFNKVQTELTGIKIYLDQNVLSEYTENEKTKEIIKNLKSKKDVSFFYSPSNLEEIYKIPAAEKRDFVINALSELTEDSIILPEGDKNIFFKEHPSFGLRRISKYQGSTEALEELKVLSSKDRGIYLEKYNTNEHKQRIANNDDIFNSLDDDEFRELLSLCHSGLYEKDSFKGIESRVLALHAIYTLSKILDLLGYKIDKKEKTQKSSLHDIEHLAYGLDSDLFVTNDHKLKCRAIQIYKFLNAGVKVIDMEELSKLV